MRNLWVLVTALSISGLAGAAEPPPLVIAELGDLTFESGEILRGAKLAYRHAGKLNADKSNAILFPTWFTGTSEDLFATGSLDAIDTDRFFLIAVDAFGNGVSSSPSNDPDFPSVTIW